MKKSLVGLAVILCLGLVMLGVSSAQHKSPFEDVTEGALRAIVGEGEEQKILDFPLKHTEVEAEISGLDGY